jgi:hypothetical protein
MAIVQIQAGQCRKDMVIILDNVPHTVKRIYVSKPDRENPYNSLVTIETDAGQHEMVGHAKVLIEHPTPA